LHAFGERASGFETGITEYSPMALEPHVIDTFDEAADPDAAALAASIEKTIGPLPVSQARVPGTPSPRQSRANTFTR